MPLASFGPVIPRTVLAVNKVVGAEETTERTRADDLHGSWLEVYQDRARHILGRSNLVVIHRYALQLEVRRVLVTERKPVEYELA